MDQRKELSYSRQWKYMANRYIKIYDEILNTEDLLRDSYFQILKKNTIFIIYILIILKITHTSTSK